MTAVMPAKYSAKPDLGWLRPEVPERSPWLVPAMFFAAVIVAVVFAVVFR
jgi:hypothetical protein